MKHVILALLGCAGALCSHAAEESIVPAPLEAVLPKIKAGMTIAEVEAVLARSYPGAQGRLGIWSGQTGYIDFTLDKKLTLSVAAITKGKTDVVHESTRFYLNGMGLNKR